MEEPGRVTEREGADGGGEEAGSVMGDIDAAAVAQNQMQGLIDPGQNMMNPQASNQVKWETERRADELERVAYNIRANALEAAVRVMSHSVDANLVLSAARSFLAFLKNADNPNAVAVEEVKSW